MAIKLLIVDDHGVLRAGLRALLNNEADMEVIGEASNAEEAAQQVLDHRPDVVLMDISLSGESGIEITKLLTRQHSKTKVLMLTIHEDETLLRAAIQAGASGYILKRAVESELVNAIRAVAGGDMYIHPAMTRSLLKAQRGVPKIDETITLTWKQLED